MVNGNLPDGYGETRVVLIPVDPYLVHVYWELSGSDTRWVKRLLADESSRFKAVLRFHDVTALPVGGFHAAGSFDVEIRIESCNWYVRLLSPERSYIVDLGLRGRGGRFHRIALSNRAGTPRAWPCEEAGEDLMRVEEGRGGVHVDRLSERQPAGDTTPVSQVAAKGAQVRPVTEGHLAVAGLPNVSVGTAVPERIPSAKPSPRPAEPVEEPLFTMEEESGAGEHPRTPSQGVRGEESVAEEPARASSHRVRGEESRPPPSAGPDDARDGPRAELGEIHERNKGKSVPGGEGGARSGPPPGGRERSTEFDLSLWCEDQFVSGLSSTQMTRDGKEDDQE
jgi:hypothetical protein